MASKKHESETNNTERKFLRKRTLDSDSSMPALKKKSVRRSIGEHRQNKKSANGSLVTSKSNASVSPEIERDYIRCKKCFYDCQNPRTYEKHSCDNVLANMKSCVVVLNTFPELALNNRGNFLFFQCRQCNRYFMNGYLYSQHRKTHPETLSDKCVKTISLKINGLYPAIDEDVDMLFDADENTDDNATFVKPNESNSPVSNALAQNRDNNLVLSEMESIFADICCPKCFYRCKSSVKFQNHSCNEKLGNMRACFVVLNAFPTMDINTKGNVLFFQCPHCSRFYVDGYSCSQHLSTKFNRSIKAISLNINSSYPTPTIEESRKLMNADENADNNDGICTPSNLDKSNINNFTSNVTPKNSYSSSQHLPTRSEMQFPRSIEITPLNINSSCTSHGNSMLLEAEEVIRRSTETTPLNINSSCTSHENSMLLEAEEDIDIEAGNANSVNQNEITINNSTSNVVQKKSRQFCCLS